MTVDLWMVVLMVIALKVSQSVSLQSWDQQKPSVLLRLRTSTHGQIC